MRKAFLSHLGPFMDRHLRLRRALGFILRSAEYALKDFDQYVSKHFPKSKTVTRPMIVDYLETTHHLHSTTRCERISTLRQFCRFLLQFNPNTYIPERNLVPYPNTKVKPYIYSEEDVNRLIQLAKNLGPSGSLRPHTYATLIALLWASGLRIGEALRLTLEDVDLENGILHIRKTKFFKSRLVPLSQSSTSALKQYRNKRAHYGHDQNPDAPFFVNGRAKCCVYDTVAPAFRFLVRKLGLKTAHGGYPRLHDLRHTFATRWLSEFYQTGKDPTAYLPVLATYLGHVNINSTQVYLHPSLELLETVGLKFREHVRLSANLILGGGS